MSACLNRKGATVIIMYYVVTYIMYYINVSSMYVIVTDHVFNYCILFNILQISLWTNACIRLLQRNGTLHIVLINILYFNKL